MFRTTLLALFTAFLCALGQVFFKTGMLKIGRLTLSTSLPRQLFEALVNPYVVCGLFVYGVSTLAWLVVLSRLKLSLAYPMISASYIFTVSAGWLIFDESVPLSRIIGVIVVCLGIYLVTIEG